ncbi:MAG: hypothetical protein CSA22_08535 [Deltaproteobacteria bacterium]|nr:MAG: hypothetical protein CSA22_08535 [Deltaproteobacteria bacterium]
MIPLHPQVFASPSLLKALIPVAVMQNPYHIISVQFGTVSFNGLSYLGGGVFGNQRQIDK